jgi:hypothetical protein
MSTKYLEKMVKLAEEKNQELGDQINGLDQSTKDKIDRKYLVNTLL